MVDTIQPSFAAGELAPSLRARVDLAKYAVGLALARNVFVHVHGGVSNRPGTTYLGETKTPSSRPRLIPFTFNVEQTYVLEVGPLYLRVIKDGGYVLDGDGDVYELATPYHNSDLDQMKFVQSADVMTFTHPAYAPRDLTRTGHAAWTLEVISFQPDIPAPTGGSSTVHGSAATTEYRYVVTAVADETLEESLPSAEIVVTTGPAALSSTDYVELDWTAVAGASEYNVYRFKNGLFGWIGTTKEVGGFEDKNIAPDLSDTPPGARNPFDGTGNYPGTVGYYEERKFYGGSLNKPQTWWSSQTGSYRNFNTSTPLKDDDAITRTLNSRQVNAIRHIVDLNDLIIFTASSEWKVNAGGDPVMTPSAALSKRQSNFGCSHVAPLIIGDRVLFVQEKGAKVRDLGYTFELDGYAGSEISILSHHLLDGHRIVDWAYQQSPHSLIWAVRDDGILLSLAYLREHEVWAWSWHETDGEVESVACVAEDGEDALYMTVRRVIAGTIKRCIERLHSRSFDDVADAFFVDSGLTYDGIPATVISGLDHLEGAEVAILADGSVFPRQVVANGSIVLPRPCRKVHVGLPYTAEIQTLPVDLGQPTAAGKLKRVVQVLLKVLKTRGLWVGPELGDRMTEVKARSTEAMGSPARLKTGDIEVNLDPAWRTEAAIYVQQRDPLPFTILGAVPRTEIGG